MSSIPITVLGASGFIGRHVVAHLRAQGVAVSAPARDDLSWLEAGDLGHVLYCIGLTADFRSRLNDTAEAHVCLLNRALRQARFRSLLYLSSTRVYDGAASTAEDAALTVRPGDPSHVYNLSKLTGEALCLADPRPGVRVARLSNVYGRDLHSDNFLTAVITEALATGRVRVGTAPGSEKDYIAVDDVVTLLLRIATGGPRRLYNVAAGVNTSHEALLGALAAVTGCAVEYRPDAPAVRFPVIETSRIRADFGFRPASLLDGMGALVAAYRAAR